MAYEAKSLVFYGLDEENNPVLKLEPISIQSIEDGEILIRMSLATVCTSDLHTLSGKRPAPLPAVLGHEGIGVILASKRPGFVPGDRITFSILDNCGSCYHCVGGLSQKCEKLFKYGHEALNDGCPPNGCYSSLLVLRCHTCAVRIPAFISDRVAAPANCALATMVNAVGKIPASHRCETVLVQGAGILGIYGCALLKERGTSKVYISDVNTSRLKTAGKFGGIAVNLSESPNGMPAPNSVDVIFEVCGHASVFPQGIQLLRPGGLYVLVGLVHPNTQLDVTGFDLIKKCLTIIGVHNYSSEHLQQAVEFLKQNNTKYPFDELVGLTLPMSCFKEVFRNSASHFRIGLLPDQ